MSEEKLSDIVDYLEDETVCAWVQNVKLLPPPAIGLQEHNIILEAISGEEARLENIRITRNYRNKTTALMHSIIKKYHITLPV